MLMIISANVLKILVYGIVIIEFIVLAVFTIMSRLKNRKTV